LLALSAARRVDGLLTLPTRSWKLVATALAPGSGSLSGSATLAQFLQDDYVRSLLQNPSAAFPAPDQSSKTDFDTKTAPIHATPDSVGAYDINKIKEDAKWLSQGANISQVAALRIVVLEFQSRPASHLAGPLSTQDAVNLQEAAGINNGSISNLLPLSTVTMDADDVWKEFEKDESRRLRIFRAYLSERRYLAMAADLAQAATLVSRAKQITAGPSTAEPLYPVLPVEDPAKQAERIIEANLKHLSKTMEHLSEGYEKAITEKELRHESLELDWLTTLVTEIVHSLSLVFQALHQGDDNFFAAPETVLEWFSLMEAYMFLDGLGSVSRLP
jgi:nuclear pore complex protein Nup188